MVLYLSQRTILLAQKWGYLNHLIFLILLSVSLQEVVCPGLTWYSINLSKLANLLSLRSDRTASGDLIDQLNSIPGISRTGLQDLRSGLLASRLFKLSN
jgi:hypothetical protein